MQPRQEKRYKMFTGGMTPKDISEKEQVCVEAVYHAIRKGKERDMVADRRSSGGLIPSGTTYNTSAGDGPEYFTPGGSGKIAPPKPHWTKEPPTVPGWYWLNEDGEKSIVEIRMEMELVLYDSGSEIDRSLPGGCEWYGPLTPPG